jgi:hypothetical protein
MKQSWFTATPILTPMLVVYGLSHWLAHTYIFLSQTLNAALSSCQKIAADSKYIHLYLCALKLFFCYQDGSHIQTEVCLHTVY